MNVAGVSDEWNQTATEYPKEKSVHELFAEQVRQRPEAIALEYGEETVSYGELDGRANELADQLRAIGVGAGTRVALSMR